GSAIRVDVRGREVMRVLPRLNEEVNEEWISDKSRFIWDGLRSQRLDKPYIRENGNLRSASWDEAFELVASKLKTVGPDKTAALVGDLNGVEEVFALKSLMEKLEVKNLDCRESGSPLGEAGGRAGYIFNSTIAGIEEADAIMLIGCNPRLEAPVLNSRIRKRYLSGNVHIGVIGERADLTYPYTYLGDGTAALEDLTRHKAAKASRPMFIIGQGALARPDGKAVLATAMKAAQAIGVIKDDWNGFNVLHTAAGRVGALDVCALPTLPGGKDTAAILKGAKSGDIEVVYLLGVDEMDTKQLGDAFVIYQGSHGDAGAHRADVILPGATYTEKSATYVNTEGRVQMARRANFPPGDAREDWAIIRALAGKLDLTLGFDNLAQLRSSMYLIAPHLARLDEVEASDAGLLTEIAKAGGKMTSRPFVSPVTDFYMTNPIARASKIMADCSSLRASQQKLAAAE
ncbi:MAG: molybdopterin-dependent oxidoreductase, partial [Anderseniella sp.]